MIHNQPGEPYDADDPRLGQRYGRRPGGKWWTRHGSRRLLPDARAMERAYCYVMNQKDALVVLDERGLVGSDASKVVSARHECRGSGNDGERSAGRSNNALPEPPDSSGAGLGTSDSSGADPKSPDSSNADIGTPDSSGANKRADR